LRRVLAASLFLKSSKLSPNPNEGFDFSSSADQSNPSAGPPNGSRINLARLKTRDGEVLANVVGKPLTMLVTVDPECGACKVAANEMRDVQNRVEPLGSDYYPVSVTAAVTSPQSLADFYGYTDSFGFNSPGFLWANDEESPPEALFTMVIPSHLLIDRNGVIARKWPGTDHSQRLRKRMAYQIVADTAEEVKLRKNVTNP
jgi:hypothetical protein